MKTTDKTITGNAYYAGFDPGSGAATLQVIPVDDIEMAQDICTIPSIIADVDMSKVLDRGDVDATLAKVLRKDEYAITMSDGSSYALHDLAIKEGRNATDALGAADRYWSNHSRILLLALACMLIPERSFELRLVTALPVSLYTKENRKRVKEKLSGYYRFSFSTKCRDYKDREVYVKVGYVGMEGQGILIHGGAQNGMQAIVDIGERTTDVVTADGQQLLTNRCKGDEIGVGQIVDDLNTYAHTFGRRLSTTTAHDILRAYAHGKSLPRIVTDKGDLPESGMLNVIEKSIKKAGRSLNMLISSALNAEGANVASDYDMIYLAGGGAHYFEDTVKTLVGRVERVNDPELANARGYADLAISLEEVRPEIWEMD
jgi:hypothetical protein